MFLDDARAVADWDAQLDPVVPLERRDRQEVDAVRHEPAGVLRELQRRQERRDVLRAGSRGARGRQGCVREATSARKAWN